MCYTVFSEPQPPLVLVFEQAERLDCHTLSGVMNDLEEAFSCSTGNIRVVVVLFQSACCPLPLPLSGGKVDMELLSMTFV